MGNTVEEGGAVTERRLPATTLVTSSTEREVLFRELGRTIDEIAAMGEKFVRLFDQYKKTRERLTQGGTRIEHDFDAPVMAILSAYETMKGQDQPETNGDVT